MDQRTLIQGRQILQEIAVVDIFRFFQFISAQFSRMFSFYCDAYRFTYRSVASCAVFN